MPNLSAIFPAQHLFSYTTTLVSGPQTLPAVLSLPEIERTQVIQMEQVHGADFAFIDKSQTQKVPGVDAVVTNQPGTTLIVRTADCLPILIYHPLPLIAVIHAGRRGTQQQILSNTLTAIRQKYSVSTGFSIWFGPRICEECYQISRDTNLHFDLVKENTTQLETLLKSEDYLLNVDEDCTCHMPEKYHSYRREGQGVAMNYSMLSLL